MSAQNFGGIARGKTIKQAREHMTTPDQSSYQYPCNQLAFLDADGELLRPMDPEIARIKEWLVEHNVQFDASDSKIVLQQKMDARKVRLNAKRKYETQQPEKPMHVQELSKLIEITKASRPVTHRRNVLFKIVDYGPDVTITRHVIPGGFTKCYGLMGSDGICTRCNIATTNTETKFNMPIVLQDLKRSSVKLNLTAYAVIAQSSLSLRN